MPDFGAAIRFHLPEPGRVVINFSLLQPQCIQTWRFRAGSPPEALGCSRLHYGSSISLMALGPARWTDILLSTSTSYLWSLRLAHAARFNTTVKVQVAGLTTVSRLLCHGPIRFLVFPSLSQDGGPRYYHPAIWYFHQHLFLLAQLLAAHSNYDGTHGRCSSVNFREREQIQNTSVDQVLIRPKSASV